MRPKLTAAVAAVIAIATSGGARIAHAAQGYTPPVTVEDHTNVSTWFGRLKTTGKWCSFDRKTMERRSKRDELIPGEFGWMRSDAHGLQSVTYAQESEDAYVEDRYFIGPNGTVVKMVRTGHYINDPWASVTFAPDAQGRLRLTAASKAVVEKMNAAEFEPYWVDWKHYSRLAQVPFATLIDASGGTHSIPGC